MTAAFEKFDEAALHALIERALPAMRAVDVFTIGADGDPVAAEQCMLIADRYLSQFVGRVIGGDANNCICCETPLTGISLLGGIGGSFRWGIAHGEGSCARCGYPARAIHAIEGVARIANLVLQYHPSGLSFPRSEVA